MTDKKLPPCRFCDELAGDEPNRHHWAGCQLFEPEWDPDEMPAAPFNGFVDRPKTPQQELRLMYLEAMYAAAMSKWYRRQGKDSEADEWWGMFEQHRELVGSFDKRMRTPDPEDSMPRDQKWTARECLTPGCDGVFWTTNFARWLSRNHSKPLSGLCPKCEREKEENEWR